MGQGMIVASSRIIVGNAIESLKGLGAASVQCVVTSPPYWGLRDYGVDNQIGLEPTLDEFIAKLVAVFREVRRVLRDDGTLWLNCGDSYTSGGNRNGLSSSTNQRREFRTDKRTPDQRRWQKFERDG